jgi:hypothetical protein
MQESGVSYRTLVIALGYTAAGLELLAQQLSNLRVVGPRGLVTRRGELFIAHGDAFSCRRLLLLLYGRLLLLY